MFPNGGPTRNSRRRGVVAVLVAVILVTLLGFAALTVDVGAMYNARAELQRSADAAALAARTIELCASAELRQSLGRRARESVVAECSADTIYARTMELYRFALGHG